MMKLTPIQIGKVAKHVTDNRAQFPPAPAGPRDSTRMEPWEQDLAERINQDPDLPETAGRLYANPAVQEVIEWLGDYYAA
jgi:hypothetical protein